MRFIVLALALCLAISIHPVEIIEETHVDDVWAGHPVGFALLTRAPHQFATYYNAERQMVVASRLLSTTEWTRVTLPEEVAWDSHNYLTMRLDARDNLHLSGNMHCVPLVYFKTTRPLDITSFSRVDKLVGTEENRMTYPRFFQGPSGEFIFTYRDGSSGSGNQIYNLYDVEKDSWARLLDRPLTDGQGKMNAYLTTPQIGPDGKFHIVWVWRDTPDCETNHDVSYLRSRDLRHWENVRGEPMELPVTIASPGAIVDPVPPGGGLINGNAKLGFDLENRPVVTYHKYDEQGYSQVFNARWNGVVWDRVAASSWETRWDFGGRGSIDFNVRVQPVKSDGNGGLVQEWSHWELGRERWRIDPLTLRAVEKLPLPPSTSPPGFGEVRSTFPGMGVMTAGDLGRSPDVSTHFVLRWETLGKNRDRPHEPPLPGPSPLILYKIQN